MARGRGLVVGEEGGFDDDAEAEGGVEFLVGEEAFAVAVVVLQEEVLVVAFEEAVVEVDDCVVVESPPATFDQRDGEAEASVAGVEGCAHLIDACVVEEVGVFVAVDDRNPEFGVDGDLGVNHDGAAERDAVP